MSCYPQWFTMVCRFSQFGLELYSVMRVQWKIMIHPVIEHTWTAVASRHRLAYYSSQLSIKASFRSSLTKKLSKSNHNFPCLLPLKTCPGPRGSCVCSHIGFQPCSFCRGFWSQRWFFISYRVAIKTLRNRRSLGTCANGAKSLLKKNKNRR